MDVFRRIHDYFFPAPAKPTHQKRICSNCNLPIKRSHKYIYFVRAEGDGLEQVTMHRDCSDPELKQVTPQIEITS